MQPDSTTRALLAGILVCLLVLVVQGLRRPGAGTADEGIDRYKVTVIRSADPWLMRLDSATGEVQQYKMKGPHEWVTLGAPGSETLAEAAEEPAGEPEAPAAPPTPPRAAATPPSPPAPAPAVPPPPASAESELAALAEAVTAENPLEVRVWAAGQLLAMGGDGAVARLLEALEGQPADVVVGIVAGLDADSGPARAALRDLARHPDPAVQAAARAASATP